jgi:hypothetical protein
MECVLLSTWNAVMRLLFRSSGSAIRPEPRDFELAQGEEAGRCRSTAYPIC